MRAIKGRAKISKWFPVLLCLNKFQIMEFVQIL